MIQMRYQYFSSEGIKWTPWRNYMEDNSQLDTLKKQYPWQLKGRLKNEFKIV